MGRTGDDMATPIPDTLDVRSLFLHTLNASVQEKPRWQGRVAVINWIMRRTDFMNTHLPADLERFVQAKVQSGRFTSSDEAIAAAVRLLRQQEEAEEARRCKAFSKDWRMCGLAGPSRSRRRSPTSAAT